MAEAVIVIQESLESDLFSSDFMIKRPLLQALEEQPGGPPGAAH